MALMPLWALVACLLVPGSLGLKAKLGIKAKGARHQSDYPCERPISFDEFVQRYKRNYRNGTDEYAHRARLYAKRAEAVWKHNRHEQGSHTWRASINNLADWTEEALEGLTGRNNSRNISRQQAAGGPVEAAGAWSPYQLFANRGGAGGAPAYPDSISWGHLPSIKNHKHQGHCGSCWAVTALTVVNAFLDIRNKTQDLSLSQVVACTPNPHRCGGKGGCHGATSGLAFNYIMHMGLVSAQEFPYPYGDLNFRDKEALVCPQALTVDSESTQRSFDDFILHEGSQVHRWSHTGHSLGMVGWKRLPPNREHPLVRALVEDGPVAVSVAPSPDWHMYGGGVFPADRCDSGRVLKHAVVLYGYGVDEVYEMRFWRLKNSWGVDWGESGSMRLERLDDEESDCGWDEAPEKGSECAGGRKRVWVCGSCGIVHEASMPIFEG